eukprot:CAMPEP_0177442404 /NCGR_PEP_ID=MMETSP0369-20130122/4922_1 /TAXON_ID=447022 ORGANISM="Scrippsiella hangoei-like, Strain SHHI-4" /NCGR_SAMPLE_ID=MMETSP0369 /ASSEMBLY_ACC=CAM_ASM_000364 /LENGTH=47 /DNA_ID= /DNA_START= /DNA_END= /DNA_ORIENTATION=
MFSLKQKLDATAVATGRKRSTKECRVAQRRAALCLLAQPKPKHLLLA